MKTKSIRICTTVLFLIGMCLLLFFATEIRQSILQSFTLAVGTVIPSLFPMLVLSNFTVLCGLFNIQSGKCNTLMQKLFGVTAQAVPALLFGMTGGYLTGIKTVKALYEAKNISLQEAQKLCCFCVAPGLAFSITAVGDGMFASKRIGMLFFFSCTAASLLLGFFSKGKGSRPQLNTTKTSAMQPAAALCKAVAVSAEAMLSMTAWMTAFSALQTIALCLLPQKLQQIGMLFFEVTRAAQTCAQNGNLSLCAAAMGFGGLCISCQLLPDLQTLQVNPLRFAFCRLLNGITAGCISELLTLLLPDLRLLTCAAYPVKLSNTTPLSSFFLLLACLIFVLDLAPTKKTCYTVHGR